MSIWYEIKDKEDINLSDDGKILQINFDSDHNGNIWVEVPLKLIDQLRQPDLSTSLREQSLEWFFAKSEVEKIDLKEKHFKNMPIQYDSKWGFHFTFGQIEEMYKSEHP